MKSSGFNAHRRTVLHGLGALIALPFMESLVPRAARAAAQKIAGAPRLVTFFVPCGYNLASYVPVNDGPNYTLSTCMQPLAKFKTQMAMLTNLDNSDFKDPTRFGAHSVGTSTFSTYNHLSDAPGGSPATNAKSADAYAADAIAVPGNRLHSLQLGVDIGDGSGGGDNWPALFEQTNSWAGPTSPNKYLDQPMDVFTAIFGDNTAAGVSSGPSAADLARAAARKSILDATLSQTATLKGKLGALDALKLDQYLTQVRAVETQVTSLSNASSCVNPGTQGLKPDGNNIAALYTVQIQLAALALQCDATRVVNFMHGKGGSYTNYSNLTANGSPLSTGHHIYSHHGNDPNNLNALTSIVTYEMQNLANLCSALNSTQDSDGKTLLDSTIVVQSSEMADPDAHDHVHMPVMILGGSSVGMNYNGGFCKKYADGEAHMASAWLSVLDKFNAAPQGGLGNMAGPSGTAAVTARLSVI